MTFSDILLKSFSENLKNEQKLPKLIIFLFFAFFTKIVGFGTVFIADMNSACKNTLISIIL